METPDLELHITHQILLPSTLHSEAIQRPTKNIPKAPIPITILPKAKLWAAPPVLGVTVGVAGGVYSPVVAV